MKMNTKENEVSSDEDDGIESVDISRLQKRSFVAVDKEEWSNRPQIGQVEEILKGKIKIKWLHGTYNDVFEDCYTTERGKRTLWFEYIPMDKIVMADVQFTKNKRLLKEDRDELKLRYHLYDSRCNIE